MVFDVNSSNPRSYVEREGLIIMKFNKIQQENFNKLLTYCIRVDELASSLCETPNEELAKPISEEEITELSIPQRRRLYTTIRVKMNRWLGENEPWGDGFVYEQWRSELNGFINNIRLASDSLSGDIEEPEELPSVEDADLQRWFWEQGGACNGCGHKFPPKVFEIDHIVPTQLGGEDESENKQLLCPTCNRRKGQLTMVQLWAKLTLDKTIYEIPKTVPERVMALKNGVLKEKPSNGESKRGGRKAKYANKVLVLHENFVNGENPCRKGSLNEKCIEILRNVPDNRMKYEELVEMGIASRVIPTMIDDGKLVVFDSEV